MELAELHRRLTRPFCRCALALLLAFWSFGCRAGPPLSQETEYGLLRTYTQRELTWMAPALEIVPEVEELFGVRVDRPEEWWVHDTPFVGSSSPNEDRAPVAGTRQDRIEFGVLCIWNPRHFVAHEYAHWIMHRVDPFRSVPYFIEEGLAEWVARHLTSWDVNSSRGLRVEENFSVGERDLGLDIHEWRDLGPDDAVAAKHLAFKIVDTLGLDRLRELAAAGATRRDYLRAAAEASDEFTITEREPHEHSTNGE